MCDAGVSDPGPRTENASRFTEWCVRPVPSGNCPGYPSSWSPVRPYQRAGYRANMNVFSACRYLSFVGFCCE
jgi:hypothetical protein